MTREVMVPMPIRPVSCLTVCVCRWAICRPRTAGRSDRFGALRHEVAREHIPLRTPRDRRERSAEVRRHCSRR